MSAQVLLLYNTKVIVVLRVEHSGALLILNICYMCTLGIRSVFVSLGGLDEEWAGGENGKEV